MKPFHAIAALTVPFALTWIALLAGLCLTPFWACGIEWPLSISEVWKPALFIVVVLSVVAAIVLLADLLMIQVFMTKVRRYRMIGLVVVGGVIATLPRIVWGLINSEGLGAFAPQVEFLPFTLAGALFIVILARLIDAPTSGN